MYIFYNNIKKQEKEDGYLNEIFFSATLNLRL